MSAGEAKKAAPPSKIDWAVTPLVGVGPLRLGMSTEECAAILGEPVKRVPRAKGFLEFREVIPRKLPVLLFESDTLVMIDFVKQTKSLRLDDLYLFKLTRQEAIDALMERRHRVRGFRGLSVPRYRPVDDLRQEFPERVQYRADQAQLLRENQETSARERPGPLRQGRKRGEGLKEARRRTGCLGMDRAASNHSGSQATRPRGGASADLRRRSPHRPLPRRTMAPISTSETGGPLMATPEL
ncbi:hypothetical protein [Chenggangzhangella methanolivorans]|uniref:Uncharacterized protein n=1 Tax=Chenggangzhangella methanolivorans TaxID=1437009 RepID=A0A9E6RBC7_9HYPH|nr:hypothetical protein [Chenggangzhangella methanolivorans]QZO00088.1 hypothetical protein K6K41_26615 [Chenggangzhangella methanolivorans]